MKVLHVITGLGIGGAEVQLRLLLRQLPADCEVVTLTNPGAVAEALRADGVSVTHLEMRGNRDLAVLPRLTRFIRSGGYDLVHTHLYRAGVYGRVAARLAGVPSVATEHSLGATQLEGRPLTLGTRALYRTTERLGAGTLAVSGTVERRLRRWGVPAARVRLVPNGIDPAAFRFSARARAVVRTDLRIPADAYVVGGMGRQVPGKKFDDLMRAVAALPDTYLLLVGDGPERVPLLQLVQQLGVAGRVRMAASTGTGTDLGGLLAAMDLFVSLCPEETFGLSVVEALAAGLPVRYVSCPALEDLPAEEAPAARRIAPYELDPTLIADRAAGAARQPVPPAVERYHIARTAEQVMALYEEAVRGKRRGPVPAVPGQSTAEGVTAAARTAPASAPAAAPASAPAQAPAPAPVPAAAHAPAPRADGTAVPHADQLSAEK
ncbi:glycosyltransferase [Streptomyces sp. NBC_01190]|uniref:glycosyltransferase n=1 Tax=Streptomyces sp. NBC_01190 TaxID=2903767 RepID=UPI0038706D0B|nr:glycosyltransferase [Streptomyces sp. NBC_01190]